MFSFITSPPFLPSALPRHSPHKSSLKACVPATTDSVLTLASNSLSHALSKSSRLQLHILVPGLNPLLEETVLYSDDLLNKIAYTLSTSPPLSTLPTVSLLFKSAGTAAFAAKSLPSTERVTFASYFRRDQNPQRASKDANIIINPTSARGDRVLDDLETVIAEAPEAVWILLNADLGIDRAAVGMREMSKRTEFLKGFEQVFYFRNLFEIRRPQLIPVERGALLFEWGEKWKVFALGKEGFVLAGAFENMPEAEEITPCIRTKLGSQRVRSDGVDGQFLTVVAGCAVAFAVVYAVLQAGKL